MSDMDEAAGSGGWHQAPDGPHGPTPPGPAPWHLSEAWDVPDIAPGDSAGQTRPLAALVSFHYLRAAVRRRRRVFVLLALFGLLLGAAFLATNPTPRTATTTLRLTHQDGVDPSGAIATDVSLMTTRTLAQRTINALGLTMKPEDLIDSVKAVPSGSPEILQLNMSAPTEAEAVRRLDRFSKDYLSFRADQISAQSKVKIKDYEGQIRDLEAQDEAIRLRMDELTTSGDTASSALTDSAEELQQVQTKINDLRNAVDDERLRQETISSTSKVIDPAAPLSSGGSMRRVVLVLASGLIGGLALGFGVVVLRAILSDRLWLRIEVVSALDAPVLVSVGRIAPLARPLRIVRFLPWVKAADARRAVDRQRIAHAIERAVPEPGRRQSLALVCLGNSDEMRFALVAAAIALQHHGRGATIVDLTEAGGVAAAVARAADATVEWTPVVFRPRVIPSLTRGPSQLDSADWEDVALAKGRSGVTLILADLDPAVGVDHLTAWSDDIIVAVTGGTSGAELIRTTGDLVRSVGLQLRGAVLVGAVRDDMSSGIARTVMESGTEAGDLTRPYEGPGRPLER